MARAPLVRHSPLQPGAPALALTVAFVSWGWGAADTHKSLSALDPKHREEMLSGDMRSIPPKLGSLKSLGVSRELSWEGFAGGTVVKHPPVGAADARDADPMPGSGRPPKEERHPTAVLWPAESQGQGSLAATVHGVAQSWTRLSDWTRLPVACQLTLRRASSAMRRQAVSDAL